METAGPARCQFNARAKEAPGLVAAVATLDKGYDLEYIPFRKLIALPGDAGRACRPRGIGLGG